MAMDLVFADQIGSVHMKGNLVRFDLLATQSDDEETNELKLAGRLIMPLEGFIKAFNLQEELISQLTQNGVLMDGKVIPAVSSKGE